MEALVYTFLLVSTLGIAIYFQEPPTKNNEIIFHYRN